MPKTDTLPLAMTGNDDEAQSSAAPRKEPMLPPDMTYGRVVRVEPGICDICSFNGRAHALFNPMANRALIDSIRDSGQQVPVIVRAARTPGRLELVAGTRRFNAVRYLRAFDPSVTLLAEVREMTDQEAWVLAEAENADREDMSELERAKNWQRALAVLFDGNQSTLARSLGVDKSVVSRMIALANIPDVIVDLVARPEALRAHFAEQMAPALNDPDRREELLGLAANLAEGGIKLAPAELARRLLLPPAAAEAYRPVPIKAGRQERQAIWQRKANGSSQLTIKPVPEELSREDRKALVKALTERIKEHVGRG